MTEEPVVVSAPDTGGRYFLLPMLDMWSDVFASPGWRTTGTKAAGYLVIPQKWKPEVAREKLIAEHKLPVDTQIINAPTAYVWIIGRTKTDGPVDYEAVAILTLVLYSCASMRGEAGSGTYLHAL